MLWRTLTLLLLIAGSAGARDGRISLLDGKIHRNIEIRSLSDEALTWADSAGHPHSVPIEDVVGYSHPRNVPALPGYEPNEVSVLLRGGDVVNGRLVASEEEKVAVNSPLLGKLELSVDDVREIRFLDAWVNALEKPSAQEENDLDVVIYDNLDTLSCTYLMASGTTVLVATRTGDSLPINYQTLLGIRFADLGGEAPSDGRRVVLRLIDGSRITAVSLSSDGADVTAKTIRDETVRFPQDRVTAFYQTGGRFRFLSDRKADVEVVIPWIGESYAWDHPRYDRSFMDLPLRSGGEVFLKGLGVVSGTSLTWKVDPGFTRFTCLFALDDLAGPEGDVIFEVLLDGKSVFRGKEVKVLREGERPVRIPFVDVSGAEKITLKVHYVDDFVRDYANWIEPMLIR